MTRPEFTPEPDHDQPKIVDQVIESAHTLYDIVSDVISSEEIGPGYSLTINAQPDQDGPLFLAGSPLEKLESTLDNVHTPKQEDEPWSISYEFDPKDGGLRIGSVTIPMLMTNVPTPLTLQRTKLGFLPLVQQADGNLVPHLTEAQQLDQHVFGTSQAHIIRHELVDSLIASARLPSARGLRSRLDITRMLDKHPDWQRTEAFTILPAPNREVALSRQTLLNNGRASRDTFLLEIKEFDNPDTFQTTSVVFTTDGGYFVHLPIVTVSTHTLPARELFPLDEPTQLTSQEIKITPEVLVAISSALLDDLSDVA